MPVRPHDIYTRAFEDSPYACYGTPLYHPEPVIVWDQQTLQTKAEAPVAIGDVGIVKEGKFHRIFNLSVSSTHPPNIHGVPPGYENPGVDLGQVFVDANERFPHILTAGAEATTDIEIDFSRWINTAINIEI